MYKQSCTVIVHVQSDTLVHVVMYSYMYISTCSHISTCTVIYASTVTYSMYMYM